MDTFFERNLKPPRILNELSIYSKAKIHPETDLVIFDEIQVSDRALNALKYFQEEAPTYHIVAAGSLLSAKLSRSGSIPVGNVNFLDLYPMTLLEFLDAVGFSRYWQLLGYIDYFTPLSEILHKDLIDQNSRPGCRPIGRDGWASGRYSGARHPYFQRV